MLLTEHLATVAATSRQIQSKRKSAQGCVGESTKVRDYRSLRNNIGLL